jgi:hypothetical protein
MRALRQDEFSFLPIDLLKPRILVLFGVGVVFDGKAAPASGALAVSRIDGAMY